MDRLTDIAAIDAPQPARRSLADRALRAAFTVMNAPFLLKSLYGGSNRAKQALLERVGLPSDALPRVGGWRADVGFLRYLADHIIAEKPRTIVEFGTGASTLVIAKALEVAGCERAQFISFEQHPQFCQDSRQLLQRFGGKADVRHAPLRSSAPDWPGMWYDHGALPDRIDLLVVDGPPWAVHPFTRGAAANLFHRIPIGGLVLLDDAARAGERMVARRWRREWPNFHFSLEKPGSKGLLVGRRLR